MSDLAAIRSITVLDVDAVGSTALASMVGHDRAEHLIAEELARFEQVVDFNDGFIIHKLGDGIMAGFHSAVAALDSAAGIHRALAQLNDEVHARQRLQIRIAVATSDVVVDDEVNGAALIHASRIEKLVPAGETWCTDAVRLLARGRSGYDFEELGAHELRGLDEPLTLHRVRTPIADVLGMPTTLDVTRRFAFVGRREEAERLRAKWRDATAGSGRLVVISGEPGCGKTRLCRELALDVRARGGIVLHGRCSEELSESYAPFVQILRTMTAHVADAASILGAGASEIARIVPEVRNLVADLAASSNVDPITDRLRLFDAISTCLEALSQRTPVLLVIDDLSWADEATVQLLRHVARRIASERVLIVASYRPNDAQPPARSLMRDRALIEPLYLRGLADDEVIAFVEALLGALADERARSRVVDVGRQVGGNPLYLGEIVPSLVDERVLVQDATGAWRAGPSQLLHVPPAVDELIRARTERLSAPCQQLLRTAAVFGFEFAAEPVIALVDLPPLAAAEALEEADAAAICRLGRLPVHPRHHPPGDLRRLFAHMAQGDALADRRRDRVEVRRGTRRMGEAARLPLRERDRLGRCRARHPLLAPRRPNRRRPPRARPRGRPVRSSAGDHRTLEPKLSAGAGL